MSQNKIAPKVNPITHVPQVNTGANVSNANTNFTQNPGYVKKSRGYPVQEGQTWHDLTPQQRNEWFGNHENRWKTRFGIGERDMQPSQSWTRG